MGRQRAAGAVLWHAGPLAAVPVLAVCVAAAVLVPLGGWRPVLALPLAALLALLALAPWGLAAAGRRRDREHPAGQPDHPDGSADGEGPAAPVWAAAASVAVALGAGLWAALTHAEHLVLRRDAGSYALFTQWIATRAGLPVDVRLEAFGGAAARSVPGFTVNSPAFYEVSTAQGVEILPQFLLGAPALFSLGWWAGGWTGLLVAPAVLTAAAVLAAAGLAARLVGPGWAPLAAAALAVTQPVLHAARSTYSEPAALLLVLAAAAIAVDATTSRTARGHDPRRARLLGLAAGLVLGLAGLVRVDAVREVTLLLPCCALLALRRRLPGAAAAGPLAAGALAGTAVSAVPALLLSRPYLASIRGSLLPLVAGAAVVAAVSAAAVLAGRWRARRTPSAADPRSGPLLPGLAAAAVVLAGLALAARPLAGPVRQAASDPAVPLIENLQRVQGLAPDGARTYAEQSLAWVTWYVGLPALVAAWAVLAVLAARAVRWWLAARDPVPRWLLPAAVGLGSTVLTLYRPGITPDHPWADRRLVVTVLPTVVLAATAAIAEAVRQARERAARRALVTGTALAGSALLLLPALVATLPVAGSRTEVGQRAAVAQVCRSLGPMDAVVLVGGRPEGAPGRAGNEWPQVVRGVCGRPAATLATPAAELPAAVARLGPLVTGAGRRLVLLMATDGTDQPPYVLTRRLGLTPRRVVRLDTREDARLLERPPRDTQRLVVEVWTAVWTP